MWVLVLFVRVKLILTLEILPTTVYLIQPHLLVLVRIPSDSPARLWVVGGVSRTAIHPFVAPRSMDACTDIGYPMERSIHPVRDPRIGRRGTANGLSCTLFLLSG